MYRSRHLGRVTSRLLRKELLFDQRNQVSVFRQTALRGFVTDHHEGVVPGARHQYGSLGDMPMPSQPVSWQAEHNQDIQNVTQKALIYELTQQQSRTIEDVVPWFLANMPPAFCVTFRMSHKRL